MNKNRPRRSARDPALPRHSLAGSQKGLTPPPGLSFTATGPWEREAHKRADLRTPYWDWTFRDGEAHYHTYCGTPPEHLLFGLRAALDMIFAEGLWTGLDFGLDR